MLAPLEEVRFEELKRTATVYFRDLRKDSSTGQKSGPWHSGTPRFTTSPGISRSRNRSDAGFKQRSDGPFPRRGPRIISLEPEPQDTSRSATLELGPRKRRRSATPENYENVVKTARFASKQIEALDYRYVKILGYGGYGITILYEMTPIEGKRRFVVIKAPLEKDINAKVKDRVDKERQMLANFEGAKHITQAHSWPEGLQELLNERDGTDAADLGLYIILDYHRRGDLQNATQKFVDAHERRRKESKEPVERPLLPNRLLWHMFDCLLKGVIDMACPPIDRKNYADEERGLIKESALLPETTTNYIHFDLSPDNVLVGDPDQPEEQNPRHPIVPPLLISDLGLSMDINDGIRQDPIRIWKTRERGKELYYTPEQFTSEWDHVETLPADLQPTGARIAGNYTWKTNLFQVGMIMWSMITLRWNPQPLLAWALDDDDQQTYTRTYGGWLTRNPRLSSVDDNLRRLVAECMIEDPARRPEVGYVHETIQEALSITDDQEKIKLRTFVDKFYCDPPEPIRVPDLMLRAWLENRFWADRRRAPEYYLRRAPDVPANEDPREAPGGQGGAREGVADQGSVQNQGNAPSNDSRWNESRSPPEYHSE
ncbi:kinase-like domain-containing protein [Lasiosphaeria ovina]|uniref:Kinase-like domain-containing protein n=1 Tax=Lasiosphaeria ovina TaxID=92902 RepID=A0AAE0TWL0_9PEZI|nr:kinase-like domain-containing protein [Lasiosphaeria ovina]